MASAAELALLFTANSSAVDKAFDDISTKSGGLASKLGGVSDKLGGVSKAMGAGLLAGGAAAVGFGAMAVAAASDVAESQNKVNVVFGESASKIGELAATAASKLGQTKGEVLNAAGGIGNLLTAMGQSKESAADMSISMVKLASDLGSFNNASSTEVLEAMQAAMAGETDGMKKYGVAITEATLKQAAMKAGLGDNVQALSAAEKQQLSLKIMLEQTTAAQGDFANTSDGMANGMKIIKSSMADAVAAIGAGLLPAVEKAGQGIAKFLQSEKFEEFKNKLIAVFSAVGEKLAQIDWGKVTDAIMAAITKVGEVFTWFSDHPAFAKIALVVGGLVTAFAPVMAVVGFLAPAFGVLGTVFGAVSSAVGLIIPAVTGLVAILGGPLTVVIGLVIAAFALWQAKGEEIVAWVSEWGGRFITAFKEFFGIASPSKVFADLGINLLEGLIEGIVGMVGAVISTFTDFGAQILATVQAAWDAYWAVVTAVSALILEAVTTSWTAIKDIITERIEAARVMISAKWDAIKEYLTGVLAAVGKVVTDAWEAVKTTITTALDKVRETVNTVWDWIGGFIYDTLGKIDGFFRDTFDAIETKTGISMGAVRDTFDSVLTVVYDLVDAFIALFKGDWEGMWDAIHRATDNAWTAVKDAFARGWAALGKILDPGALVATLKSGLAAFERIGGDIVDGIKAGLSKGWATMEAFLRNLFGDILTLAKKILGIASPSKVMRDQVGQPIAMGIVEGIRMTLAANPIAGLVAGWAQASNGASIGAVLGGSLKAAVIAGLMLSGATNGGALIEGRAAPWDVNAKSADGRMGLQKGPGITKAPSDDRVRADAFRSGKGGLLAASSSNYWQVFVAKWGVPTEASAIKVSKQLGIPLPQWLLDIYHPPSGETVDRPDVLKDPTPAEEAGKALQQLAKVIGEVAQTIPAAIAIAIEELRGTIVKVRESFDDLIPRGNAPVVGLPGGGGIGGPIPIPGPGGTTAFGTGGSAPAFGGMTLAAQTVQLNGPVQIGMNATLQIGGGRTLTATLVDALIADTASFDRLITAEDNRRARKP